MDKQLEYAKLVIEVGINLQKGQRLVIASPVSCAEFARKCATAAYDAGCKEVVMNWRDDYMAREKYLKADSEIFDEVPAWRSAFYNDYANEGAAYLAICASDPENMLGVDADRIMRSEKASGKALADFRRLQMINGFQWCIVSIPIDSWAKKVFPNEENPSEKLWEAIYKAMRVEGKGTAVENWRNHLDRLETLKAKLNSFELTELNYTNSLGTDLTIGLPEGHRWESGADVTTNGVRFVANMPTEEIFTAPHRLKINGRVYSALPLIKDGTVIDKFYMDIKDGKIINLHAEKGEDILKNSISVDEGASYFGEVALVPYDSPISNMKTLFYETLFDENASCHLAFGEAYPSCLEGGNEMSKEELKEHGLNDSIAHCDFMVGTADLNIIGTNKKGEKIQIFKQGNFAF